MVKEAKEHADEDKKNRESIDVKNSADALIYSTEKLIKDMGDKVPADMKTGIDEQIKVLRKAMESNDTEQIKRETEELQKIQNELSQKLYAQSGAGAGQGAGAGGQGQGASGGGQKAGGNEDEDVIDAEFEAKDDK